MQPETNLDVEKLASEYLTSVQSLSAEIAGATSAIARNDLTALVKHVESQQRLCNRLLALELSRHHLRADPAVWISITNAMRTLASNNKIYSVLLVFSGRSHQAMLTLCRAYNDSSNQVAGQNQLSRALSCEV